MSPLPGTAAANFGQDGAIACPAAARESPMETCEAEGQRAKHRLLPGTPVAFPVKAGGPNK